MNRNPVRSCSPATGSSARPAPWSATPEGSTASARCSSSRERSSTLDSCSAERRPAVTRGRNERHHEAGTRTCGGCSGRIVHGHFAGRRRRNEGPTLRSLQAQIKTLQKQVKTLKKQETATENLAVVGVALSACSTPRSRPTHCRTPGPGSTGTSRRTRCRRSSGPRRPVNDYSLCSVFSVVRAHNQSPPNTNILRALLDIFKARSFAAQQPGVNLPGQARDLFGQLFVLPSQVGVGIK